MTRFLDIPWKNSVFSIYMYVDYIFYINAEQFYVNLLNYELE